MGFLEVTRLFVHGHDREHIVPLYTRCLRLVLSQTDSNRRYHKVTWTMNLGL